MLAFLFSYHQVVPSFLDSLSGSKFKQEMLTLVDYGRILVLKNGQMVPELIASVDLGSIYASATIFALSSGQHSNQDFNGQFAKPPYIMSLILKLVERYGSL
jgi:hypothetical protein